jgi:hypothetical protein
MKGDVLGNHDHQFDVCRQRFKGGLFHGLCRDKQDGCIWFFGSRGFGNGIVNRDAVNLYST